MGQLDVGANIDRCLELLDDHDLSAERRSAITKALIDEENKLGHGLEQLELAESRMEACRERLRQLRRFRNRFRPGSRCRTQTDLMIENFQSIVLQAEKICSFMRKRLQDNQLSALRETSKHSRVYRGISYSLQQASEPDGWVWEFKIGERLRRGRTRTRLHSLAERRVKMLIDREFKMASRATKE